MSKRLRVALMTHTLDNRPGMGTARVARKTAEALLADPRFEVTLVHYEKTDDPLYNKTREIVIPELPTLPFGTRFFRFLLFCWRYRYERFDIIHWFQPRLYPFFWLAPARKLVVTAHGGGDVTAPQTFSFSRQAFNTILRLFHPRVDAVIAVSAYGREEIAQAYGIPVHKIFVVYNGGAEEFVPMAKEEARKRVHERYGVEAPYILTVSRLVPHKNVEGLIRAYNRARELGVSQRLVIVGGRGGWQEQVYKEAKSSPYKSGIHFIEHVAQEDLNAFYAGSDLFVFPSLNEGWGMPVIEAFASGVPVVASNAAAIPETAGNAAVLVNVLDREAFATALQRVLADEPLRRELVQKGLARAKEFAWKRTANETVAVYESVLAN